MILPIATEAVAGKVMFAVSAPSPRAVRMEEVGVSKAGRTPN
jgi:hypothetical protein